jgi:hypothetical protein
VKLLASSLAVSSLARMKQSLREVAFTAVCVPLIASGADSINLADLHYKFAPEVTNAYQLEIESQGEAGREMIAGVYTIGARAMPGNLTELTFHGRLMQKPIPGRPMMMAFRGPGYAPTLSSYAMQPFNEGMELVIDEHGRVMRQAGDSALPVPLGQLMTSLIRQFPHNTSNEWSSDHTVNVADEPLSQGPAANFARSPYAPYYPGQSGLGILSATIKNELSATATNEDSAVIHRTFTLESWMSNDHEPRVRAEGDETTVFDQKAGLPRTVELQCKASVATEDVSRRSVLKLRWRLLEGAEREAALKPPEPLSEIEVAPDDLTKLREKLNSEKAYERQEAARRLSSSKMTSVSPELLSLMVKLTNDGDEMVQNSALTFVADHATEEQAMLLIKSLMSATDQNVRSAVIKSLGRLKDKRAAQPLADAVAMGPTEQLQYNSSRNTEAVEALESIGPEAETAVLGLLKERNNATRWQACQILKHIGSGKSVPALKELIMVPSKELSEAAADACRSIEARDGR